MTKPEDQLGELALKHGPIVVDLMGDGLAWQLPGSDTWTPLSTPEPSVNAGLAEVEKAIFEAIGELDGEDLVGSFMPGEERETVAKALALAALSVVTIPDEKGEALADEMENLEVEFRGGIPVAVVSVALVERILAALRASPSPSIREGVLEEAAKVREIGDVLADELSVLKHAVGISPRAHDALGEWDTASFALRRALKNPSETKGGGL